MLTTPFLPRDLRFEELTEADAGGLPRLTSAGVALRQRLWQRWKMKVDGRGSWPGKEELAGGKTFQGSDYLGSARMVSDWFGG